MKTKKSILLADNTEDFCTQLESALLNSNDFEIIGTANDGEQAIELVRQQTPDVLILDLTLPKRDGLAVLKALSDVTKRPFVFLLIPQFTVETVCAASDLGANITMQKPAVIKDILEIMNDNVL